MAKVVSAHVGSKGCLHKPGVGEVQVELDGIVGDRHRSYVRSCWAGDKQPKGTVRRNERQWSAIGQEELAAISQAMDLDGVLTAADVGVNFCFEGIPELSRLPKGTLLTFPSGAQLSVEEFNPPCRDMSEDLAKKYRTRSGKPPSPTAFSKAAKLARGIVGVVEVAGVIRPGDPVDVEIYRHPAWLKPSDT